MIYKNQYLSMIFLSFFSYISAFLTQILVAFYFGTSRELDAYWLCIAIIGTLTFFVHPLRESIVSSAFKSSKDSIDKASQLITSGFITLIFLCFLASLVLLFFLKIYNFTPESSLTLAGGILTAFIPYLFLFAIAETCNILMTSFNMAIYQAFARLISAISVLISLFILKTNYGIYGMIISLSIGQIFTILVSAYYLYSKGLKISWGRINIFKDKVFVAMFLSLVINYVISQGYVLYERWGMGLFGNGVISSYQYSVLIVTSIISMLAYPMINLTWPKFLEQEHSGNKKLMIQSGINASAPMLFVIITACIFIFRSAEDVITILFYRGEFNSYSLELTLRALYLTIFAAVPISIYTIGLRLLMSQRRSKLVAFAGSSMGIIGVFIIFISIKINSVYLLQSHWLISNTFGALFVVSILIKDSNIKLNKIPIMTLKPLSIVLISIIFSILLLEFYDGPSKLFLTFSLLFEALIYFLLILFFLNLLKIITFADIKKSISDN